VIGKILGNYRITQKLGEGGVGEVWKAIDKTLDREVALKILRPELAAQESVVARFRTEALALARLNHPNVATIHGFHDDGGTSFIVMEYIPGQTLYTIVRGFGPMQSERALPLFFQVLDAIGHAHENGIVHRDLKASNVMISHHGAVKMLDFGIARVAGSLHLTQGPSSLGTPAWMAPEQVRGEEADARTDIYALGLLLYWLVTARLPFESENHFDVQRAHVDTPPPSPRHFAANLPIATEKAILRALAKPRAERFANVGALRLALGEGFTAADTIPLLTDTMLHPIHRTLRFDADGELEETRSSLAPLPERAEAIVAPREVPAARELVGSEAPPVVRAPVSPAPPRAAKPQRATRSQWLTMAIAALVAVFAIAAGLRALRPAPVAPDAPGLVIASEPEVPAPVRAEIAPAASAAPPASAAPAKTNRVSAAANAKRKPATSGTPRGDDGWVIKR
jgi:serine/threonine-protein kinase